MRQFYGKDGPFVDPGTDGEGALVQEDDLVGKRQSDAMAFGIVPVGASVERGKDMGDILGGDTDAIVGEAQDRIGGVEADGDRGLVVLGEFTPVLDQVGKSYL